MQCSKRRARVCDDLFNHLVGDCEQGVRNGNAERLGGVEVDDQFEFCRLHDRQFGRFFALENAAGIEAGLLIRATKAFARNQ